jgi:hypothetical protein
MLRYAFALTLALGITAGVAAAVQASASNAAQETRAAANQTVVEKNSPFPVVGPIIVQECKVEDCSDVTG